MHGDGTKVNTPTRVFLVRSTWRSEQQTNSSCSPTSTGSLLSKHHRVQFRSTFCLRLWSCYSVCRVVNTLLSTVQNALAVNYDRNGRYIDLSTVHHTRLIRILPALEIATIITILVTLIFVRAMWVMTRTVAFLVSTSDCSMPKSRHAVGKSPLFDAKRGSLHFMVSTYSFGIERRDWRDPHRNDT